MSKKKQKKLSARPKTNHTGRRWQKMRDIKMNNKMGKKLVGLFLLVILALVGLAIRITAINIRDGKRYERIVLNQTQQQYESRSIPFKRGDIKDRNGTILATSDKVYNLILDCKVVNSETRDKNGDMGCYFIEPTVEALVKLFDMDEQTVRGFLESEETKDSQYVVLAENLSISEKQKFEDYIDVYSEANENLPDEEIIKRERVKGIWFEEDYLRVYPMNSMACDLIGFADAYNNSNYGIEGYYSDILNGTNGRQFGYFNGDAAAEQTIIDPVPGRNVISTIDVNVQQIIRSAMEKYIAKYSNGPNGPQAAENIGIVVMDPNTGEVLGMDSSNWYDLNKPLLYTKEEFQAMSDEEYNRVNKELAKMWKNYCISDSFEPGSTFKPVTVAAALETSVVSSTDQFFCDGLEKIKNATLHCVVFPDQHYTLDLAGALKVSCNDVLMQVAAKLGPVNMLKYQELFNFGMKTGIDLPGENSGVLHTEEGMGEVELATTSFGQGFTCTMIQEAAAFSAVVNGGYYYKPHVVSAITDSNGSVSEHVEPVVERQVISSGVSNQIREWLGHVVEEDGSGSVARVGGYSMGGKTGTAQKVNVETKAYDGNYVVSFIGCAPLEKPDVVVYVVIDTPNAENQGTSTYAQEIAREIFIELLPYMNIFPDDPAATEAFIAQLREQEAQEAVNAELAKQNADAAAQAGQQPGSEQPVDGIPADGQSPEAVSPETGVPEGVPTADGQGQGQTVLDTDIPVPGDVPEENGGNTIFSDGIPNSE